MDKKYFKKYGEFLANNVGFISWVSFWVLFSYGVKIFFYTITEDSEVAHLCKDNTIWVGLGRWGVTFLKNLLGSNGNFAPYAAHFLGACFLGLAVIAWILVWTDLREDYGKVGWEGYIFSALYISYPMYATLFNFSIVSFECSFGILLCAIGVLLVNLSLKTQKRQEKVFCLMASILCLGMSVSIYQSFIALMIVGFCISLLYNDILKSENTYKIGLIYLIVVFLSGVFYLIFSVTAKEILGVSGHLEGEYIGWGRASITSILNSLWVYFKDLVYQPSEYTRVCGYTLMGSMLIITACAVYMLLRKRFFSCVLLVLIEFGMLYIPFLLGTWMPGRSQLVIPLIIAFTGSLLVSWLKEKPVFKVIVVTLLLLISTRNAFTINKLYYGDYMKYRHDEMMITKISSQVEKLGLGEIPNKPVVILGAYTPRENSSTMRFEGIGRSIFEYNELMRRYALFNIYGYPYLTPTDEQVKTAITKSVDLPTWPSEGSIADVGEVIVVKLDDVMPEGYVDKIALYRKQEFHYSNLPITEDKCLLEINPSNTEGTYITFTDVNGLACVGGYAIDMGTNTEASEVYAKVGEEYFVCEKGIRSDLAVNSLGYYYSGWNFFFPTDVLLENGMITFIVVSKNEDYVYYKTYTISPTVTQAGEGK